MNPIYENESVRIEIEESEVPWLKIFAQDECKEMTDCEPNTRSQIWALLDLIELEMLDYYKPEKINIASFANYVPQVHWHIMARFKEDSFFPEPMWGKVQRKSNLNLPDFDVFVGQLVNKIKQLPLES